MTSRQPLCGSLILLALLLTVAGCGGGAPPLSPAEAIRLNQIGFYPTARKIAVLPAAAGDAFAILSEPDHSPHLTGRLGPPEYWPFSGETVRVADFSALERPGRYRVVVEKLGDSYPFQIGDGVYEALAASLLKAYYYTRSGIDLEPKHAGRWARKAGHPDRRVRVHASATSAGRPAGTIVAFPGGWYDAGDYNRYIVNSSIATHTLLAALEHYPEYFAELELTIPESGNDLPDILDEALWNLRWMLTMQDPEDGGVYHKLTAKRFAPFVLPHKARAQRYVVQKSTAAALDFAATMARASRLLGRWERLRLLALQCRRAALAAWVWAQKHPEVLYRQPRDVHTGTYAPEHEDLVDERAWAGVELFLATGEAAYSEAIDFATLAGGVPSWGYVAPLAWISLAHARRLPPGLSPELIRARMLATAERLRRQAETSAYRVALGAHPERFLEGGTGKDFTWGSNGVAGNQAMVLLTAFTLTEDRRYVDAAMANLDYLLGRNATGYCFVTGCGSRSPQHPHHRPSAADQVPEPVPGLVVGGPHDGFQDVHECSGLYPSTAPARAYVDNVCSFATNEVAINWNAPWVYVVAAVEHLHSGSP